MQNVFWRSRAIPLALCWLLSVFSKGEATNVLSTPDEASLRAAIAMGGWVSITCNGTVNLANTINITNDVVLDASSVSFGISGSNSVRIFYVAPGTMFGATNLTLANGSDIVTDPAVATNADGGAIYNDGGTVNLVGCMLTNNSAQSLIVGGVARGGAIFNGGGTVTLRGCALIGNLALGGGPNKTAPSTNAITTCAMALGGAICNTNGIVAVLSCWIASNVCESVVEDEYVNFGEGLAMGGAVCQSSGLLLITNSNFTLNQAVGGNGVQAGRDLASPAYGGALAINDGSLLLDHSRFWMNEAVGGDAASGIIEGAGFGGLAGGGAVYCLSQWMSADSSFFGNVAVAGSGDAYVSGGFGGGIYNGGHLELDRCSVYSNRAQGGTGKTFDSDLASDGGSGLGGGIFNAAQLAATNCTVALNSTIGGNGSAYSGSNMSTNGYALGGGIFTTTNATTVLMNDTIASNYCASGAAGFATTNSYPAAGAQVAATNGTLSLRNTIIAYGSVNNAYGPIADDGCNICSDDSAGLSGAGDLNDTDPKLGPLGDYGGPTWCMALRYDSPAIDAGDRSGAPATDQREAPRPNGSGVDIGSYEFYSNQIDVSALSIMSVTNSVVLSFMAYPLGIYHLLRSADLMTWTEVGTFGPYDSATNISEMVNSQDPKAGFYRLRLQ